MTRDDWPVVGVLILASIMGWLVLWTFVAMFTVPAGARTDTQDDQCYRYESRNLGGIPHVANLYWPIPCP